MSAAALTEQLGALSLADPADQCFDPLGTSPSHSNWYSGASSGKERARAESHSSRSSTLYSETGRSTPNRPPRSPLRRSKEDLILLCDDIDALQQEVDTILDKIYEIEELRHSHTSRSAHASRLDTLLSEVSLSIEELAPRVASVPALPEISDINSHLRKEWAKVMAQYALLKQEMLEDPWLIRFRTTADQADGMMDPLNNSLMELTSYAGRILSSVTVPMIAHEGRLSIERLRQMAGAHGRLKATYVPSVNKILNMMAKSIKDRSVTNGEALRRLNDMTTTWATLQRQLVQLDAKVALVLAQNDPVHLELDHNMEVLEDDHMSFAGSPRIPQVPQLDMPSSSYGNSLHRVLSAGSAPHATPPSSFSGLRPPTAMRNGSVTPNAQRSLRRSISRATLSGSVSGTANNRPRWNVSTRPLTDEMPPPLPPPNMTPRRPSHAASASSSHASLQTSVSGMRRPSSPQGYPSPPEGSSIPQRTPMRHSASTSMISPPSQYAPRPPFPSTPTQRPSGTRTPGSSRMLGARTPSGNGGRASAATPSRPAMGTRTPSGGRMSLASSTSAVSFSSSGRPTLAPALHHRLPPSSWGSRSPAPGSVSRADSRISVSSVTMANVELQPFVPSKYDLLDQEVHKMLEAVRPGVFVGRIDPSLKRGQRKTDGEPWNGEFLFGAGSRPTPVKLLELGSRIGPSGGKRTKAMVRVGGAWEDLATYLKRLAAQQQSSRRCSMSSKSSAS